MNDLSDIFLVILEPIVKIARKVDIKVESNFPSRYREDPFSCDLLRDLDSMGESSSPFDE